MLKMFLIGAGTGYVLGARAGREHYDKILAAGQRAAQHPKIAQARGVINSSAAPPGRTPPARTPSPPTTTSPPTTSRRPRTTPHPRPPKRPGGRGPLRPLLLPGPNEHPGCRRRGRRAAALHP